jgi:hypothetical protein
LRHTAVVLSSNFVARYNILDRGLDEVRRGRCYRTPQRLQKYRVDRGSRNPSPIEAPRTTILLRSFKKIVKNTVNGVDIMS